MQGTRTAPRIGLVTCLELPEPDPDRELLLDALRARGVDAEWLAWDQPGIRWEELDVAVLRSTWNYHRRLDDFRSWLRATAEKTRVRNPPNVVEWSAVKTYLADLETNGVPVIPTAYLEKHRDVQLVRLLEERGWDEVVLKPVVSAASFETHRTSRRDAVDGQRTLERLLADRDMMVQPYLRSVETYGERSVVTIDGAITHAIKKQPRFTAEDENASDEPVAIAPAERAAVERILEVLPRLLPAASTPLLYARADLAPDESGRPLVMELELVEPSLFFCQYPAALDRFVSALIREARA